MSGVFAFIGAHKAGTALASVLLVVGATQVGGPDDQTATVTRVVDGDTLDVSYDGDTHRVRLLNIDTPETVHPDEPVECMGPEAAAFLRRLLPQGTTVRLGYDDERRDRYGRELAGVFVDDLLVNAEIARAGLGAAIVVGGNDRYYKPVKQAQDEAADADRGLFSAEVPCTLPAQISAAENSAESVSMIAAPSEETGLAALDEEILLAARRVEGLRTVLRGESTAFPLLLFSDESRGPWAERLDVAEAKVTDSQQRAADARTALEARRAAEKAAAEKAAAEAAEKAAREAEAAAAREAAAQAARDAAAAEEAQRARDSARQRRTSSGTSSSGGAGSGGYDGYTGCRAYGPGGTSIDEKGRRYTKISC